VTDFLQQIGADLQEAAGRRASRRRRYRLLVGAFAVCVLVATVTLHVGAAADGPIILFLDHPRNDGLALIGRKGGESSVHDYGRHVEARNLLDTLERLVIQCAALHSYQ
jgi:hypothetical protein